MVCRMALSGVLWSSAGAHVGVTVLCLVGHCRVIGSLWLLDVLLSDRASVIGFYVYVNIYINAHTFICMQRYKLFVLLIPRQRKDHSVFSKILESYRYPPNNPFSFSSLFLVHSSRSVQVIYRQLALSILHWVQIRSIIASASLIRSQRLPVLLGAADLFETEV